MKVFYSPKKPYLSHAFQRILEGLELTAPKGTEFVEKDGLADVVIVPVVNYNDTHILSVDKRYVLMQLCYLTAGGTPEDWQTIWNKAKLVTSYLELPTNYLAMPLGYDPNKFYPDQNRKKTYRAVTSGYVDGPGAEFITEVWKAFGNILHIGKNFNLGKGYNHAEKISDSQLRTVLQSTEYVVNLRDVEGFELMNLEGAACGALPVALDLPCYRRWFPATTLFVRPDHLLEDLQRIAQQPAIHVPSVKRFEWQYVMKPFWEKLNA